MDRARADDRNGTPAIAALASRYEDQPPALGSSARQAYPGGKGAALRYRQKQNRSAHPGVRTFSGARVRIRPTNFGRDRPFASATRNGSFWRRIGGFVRGTAVG